MRLPVFILLILAATTRAGVVEMFTGEPVMGKVEADYGAILFRPANGAPAVKLDFSNLLRVQFEQGGEDEFAPGVVLRNGVRLASPMTSLQEPTIRFPRRNISIPAAEIAWIVAQRFPAALAAYAPAGETGALLRGGDFFSGKVKGAETDAVKVLNPIFGQRTLAAHDGDLLATVLRPATALLAQYNIRTTDGSLFGVDNFGLERTSLTLRHPLYDNLVVPIAELAEIRAGANRCRLLVAMPELAVAPAAGLRAKNERDLETDAGTVASCAVPANFTEFLTSVANLSTDAPTQRLVFAIYADGRAVAQSAPLAPTDAPQLLRAAVAGVRVLTLRVEARDTKAPPTVGRWGKPIFLRR